MGKLSFDPSDYHVWFDDFDKFTAADWTITTVEAGAGAATEAVGNLDGGVLVITNDDANNDADYLQWGKETFRFASGKRLYFASRLKLGDATDTAFVCGLQITDTSPLVVTDGIYFLKDTGDANLDFWVVKDSTATTKTAVSTLADDTWVKLGFYYDGSGSDIDILVNDVVIASAALTNVPNDEDLTISFGIRNGEAAAKVLSVDYIVAAKER